MKLKELPLSWWTAWQLQRLPLQQLHRGTAELLPLVVSLTSIPSRLPIIHYTIRSLLNQERKAEKIILWLHHELQHKLPDSLQSLTGDLFEIRYVDLYCSHRKLIHALAAYPDKVIVTCDDDLMYSPTWLTRLYHDHLRYPQQVVAHECRLIKFNALGAPEAYSQWTTESRTDVSETWLMPIGYGGVLYPPQSLFDDVLKSDLFLQLTPRADDLWFKAMSHLAGTATRRSSNPGEKPIPIIGSQKISLKKTNVQQDGNYQQWLALCKHYGLP